MLHGARFSPPQVLHTRSKHRRQRRDRTFRDAASRFDCALAALGGLRGVDDGRPSLRGAGISWFATRADPRGLREAVFTDLLPGAKIVGTPRGIRITTRDGDALPAFHWIALGS